MLRSTAVHNHRVLAEAATSDRDRSRRATATAADERPTTRRTHANSLAVRHDACDGGSSTACVPCTAKACTKFRYGYNWCMSDLIRTTRDELGLTGADLAARLGVTGGAISQIERSEREGRIRLDTLERALEAMGRRLSIGTSPDSPYSEYTPVAITDQVNDAIDARDGSYALRLITHAASVLKDEPDKLSDAELRTRPSQIKDGRWEQLFRAVYGDAIPEERRPDWAKPTKLNRRWYVSRFAPLREKAKFSTPDRLRELNIYIDANSLSTR
jgi:transcriptional regulator with XRE-family HTH domain